MQTRTTARRSHDGVLGRQLMAALSWMSALDGGLLTDRAWRRRHALVCGLLTVNAVIFVAVSFADHHTTSLWVLTIISAVAFAVAWAPVRSRRARVLAMVVAVFVVSAIGNEFLANASPLSSAYVVLLAVYQDWLPLAAGVVGVLYMPVLAIVAPQVLENWRAFQREPALTGAIMRTLGVFIAAAVAVMVWRTNGVAARDAMTGFATREHAERRLSQALRNGRTPAVLVCDVDAFRLAADDVSRAEADSLIQAVGNRLRGALPESDVILAAGGGAKYIVVVLGDIDEVWAQQLARSLSNEVRRAPFPVGAAEIPLTVTIGVAVGQPADEASDLMRAAELAMRRAKGSGAAAIGVADEPLLGLRPRSDGPITAELRRAVRDGEFVMYYQPQVDLVSGAIVGAEALVRWQHPTRGLLAPGSFLPYTETHPWLNVAVSRDITAMVLEQAAVWNESFPGRMPSGVAINLPASRLKDPALAHDIGAMIRRAGVDPATLVVELTEGAVMDLEIDVPTVLSGIAALGLRISLDDFGTGHSSLAHLRDFPLHEIKVDRSFVSRIVSSPSDRAVIRAVLAISAEFGADVVIEGIETAEQREVLLDIQPGAVAQGFFFAKPMPAADFTTLLEVARPLP